MMLVTYGESSPGHSTQDPLVFPPRYVLYFLLITQDMLYKLPILRYMLESCSFGLLLVRRFVVIRLPSVPCRYWFAPCSALLGACVRTGIVHYLDQLVCCLSCLLHVGNCACHCLQFVHYLHRLLDICRGLIVRCCFLDQSVSLAWHNSFYSFQPSEFNICEYLLRGLKCISLICGIYIAFFKIQKVYHVMC